MPPLPAQKKLTDAVFKSITEASYPEDENIVSAELSSSVLQGLSVLLEQARADVKASISELSRLSAADIDGWVSQAKQLRQDIDESERRSKDIVSFAAQGANLQETARDAANKVAFLEDEVAFNESITGTLKKVQELKETADTVQNALNNDQLAEATKLLKQAERQLGGLPEASGTRLVDVAKVRLDQLRAVLTETLTRYWHGLISVNAKEQKVIVHKDVEGATQRVSLGLVADSMESLDLLQARVAAFRKEIDAVILTPCLHHYAGGDMGAIRIDEDELELSQGKEAFSIETLFRNLTSLLSFLASHLPQSVMSTLMSMVVPSLLFRLLTGPLSSVVPTELNGLPHFQSTIAQVSSFAEFLQRNDWQGQNELMGWATDAPNIWLAKRSQSSLNSIRQLLKRGLGNSRAVERIETQTVSREDEVFSGNKKQDDWNAGWSDDENETTEPEKPNIDSVPSKSNGVKADHEDDEDVSGWGFDEDEAENQDHEDKHAEPAPRPETSEATETGEEDEGDAWGWGEEKAEETTIAESNSSPGLNAQQHSRQGPVLDSKQSKQREITLKETYHITALPEPILEIIVMAIEDADALVRTGSSNPVFPASKGLYLLPGSLLSMFRASAPSFYENDLTGNMYLYNDSLYLAEQLRAFVKHRTSNTASNSYGSLNLNPEIAAIELFGKRAYGKEMESQRTIVGDLMDGAQGFANCTEHPFAQECDLAISSTVDRVRELHRQWSAVLSRSALLQSIGSLLVTVTNKIIVAIEDMSDISEPESQRLTSFCNRVTALDDLFLPEQASNADPDEQPVPLTAAYTSTWLKFQYLANILESSLIDIKYLWTEGELSLEFSADEVVDMIEALFADSEHRRKAISDIRRGITR